MTKSKKSNNKKSNKAGSNQTTAIKQNNIMIPRPRGGLSPCGRDYVACLANPFDGPLACVPSEFPTLTFKQRVFVKGSMVTGTAGIGFIYVDPMNAVVNDIQSVVFSQNSSTYAGTTFGTGADTGVGVAVSNSNYAQSNFADTAAGSQFRVVSAGLRIRYSGTTLNRGGTVYGFHDPTHSTIKGSGITDLTSEVQAKLFPVEDNRWITVLYAPVVVQDGELFKNSFLSAATQTTESRWYMGFLIRSPLTTGVSFDFEYFAVHEIQGRAIRGMTMAQADPTAFAAGSTIARSALPSSTDAQTRSSNWIKSAESYLEWGVSRAKDLYSLGNTAVKGVEDLGNMLGGRSPNNMTQAMKNLPLLLEL